MSAISLTPELQHDGTIIYLVRANGLELGHIETKEKAILAIDSIAAEEQKRMIEEGKGAVEVFRQDFGEGTKVILSTQSLGYVYNGTVTKALEIDMVPIGHLVLVKGRHELEKKNIPMFLPPPPILPSPETMREVARIRAQATGNTSEDDSDFSDTDSVYSE